MFATRMFMFSFKLQFVHTSSLGVGYEIAYAEAIGKKNILCLWKQQVLFGGSFLFLFFFLSSLFLLFFASSSLSFCSALLLAP